MEIIEMLADYTEYVDMVVIFEGTAREQSWIQVHDFEGFDDHWHEIMIDIPEELEMIIGDLIDLGYVVHWDSEDI